MQSLEDPESAAIEQPLQQEKEEKEAASSAKLKIFEPSQQFECEAAQALEAEGSSKIKPFFYQKYEKEAQKNWDLFYKANKTNFFKDRHYFGDEFSQLFDFHSKNSGSTTLLDIGCGVGNALYPLIKALPRLRVNALDFSKRAVQFVKAHEEFDDQRIKVCPWDITKEELPYKEDPADFGLLVFVLSSLSPETMSQAIKNISSNLKEGAILYFRDYGRYDWAQLRFAQNKGDSKLKDNFYIRRQLTRAYYFTLEEVAELFKAQGFQAIELDNHYRIIQNRKEQNKMKRVWVQAKFIKKPVSSV